MPLTAPSSYSKYGKYLKKSYLVPTAQKQIYLEIFLSFTAVAFFGWFALRPTLTTIGQLIGEIESRQEVVDKLDKKIDSLAAARTTYEAAAPQLALLDESLPLDLQIAEFTGQIEIIALESGLEITDLTFDPFPLDKTQGVAAKPVPGSRPAVVVPSDATQSATLPTWKSLQFKITAQGTYPQLRQLVAQLHGLRRVVLLDTITLRTDNTQIQQDLTLQLNGRVAYY